MDLFDKCLDKDEGYFSFLRQENDNYFIAPTLDGPIGPRMKYNSKEVIVWSINSYLGIHKNPKYKFACEAAAKKFGAESPMGSRLMSGNSDIHNQLEQELSEFVGMEQSNLFSNGYLGIIGIISALVGPNDFIVADRQCHACLIDGMKLAANKRNFRIFRHNDTEHLEKILKSIRKKHKGGILILTEGVYGMTGEVAELEQICHLKNKYLARLLVDDAHGFGVIGNSGRGVGEFFDITSQIDIYFSTFAKAFAGIGCFCASTESVINYIKFNARANIFTKALPAIYANVALAVLNVLKEKGSYYLATLNENKTKLQNGLRDLGYNLGNTRSQITPVYLPVDIDLAKKIVRTLREKHGIFVSAVIYPVVPKNTLLLRLIPTTLHKKEDIDLTLKAFEDIRNLL